jgi:HD-GYP domain-containing protein (c-di-GMP phosphodiesterase class II)
LQRWGDDFCRPEPTIFGMLLSERLVAEGRERRRLRMEARERIVDSASAAAFLAAAVAIALFVPSSRDFDPLLAIGLVVSFAVVCRVRFEFGYGYVSPEQLLFVPILLLLPLPLVPLLAVTGWLLSTTPEYLRGEWHVQRTITCIADCWFSVGPVLVLAAFAPGDPTLDQVGFYLLALAAQQASDFSWSLTRHVLLETTPVVPWVRVYVSAARVDAVLTIIGFVVSLVAVGEPLVLVTLGPLVWLLAVFSKDRRERYSAVLELHRAYRGTVMLLVDVIESEDGYTADHSRSVVELVQAVAERMGVDANDRQELEFAALLHDVGKIAIPKEILNKPSSLSTDEFEIMKTHTIEGQFMLDRVGGVLGRVGEMVRSCHERWDGRGYPDGLKGEEIPLAARIVFVCDAYNAMTTDRPYRAAMSTDDAVAELVTNAGTQFDPEAVEALVGAVRDGLTERSSVDGVRAVLAGTPQLSHGVNVTP